MNLALQEYIPNLRLMVDSLIGKKSDNKYMQNLMFHDDLI